MNSFIQTISNYIQSIPLVIKILVLVILALLLWVIFRRSPKKGKNPVTQWSDTDYQNSILHSLPDDARFDYTHLYESIGEIYNMANHYQNCLDVQKVEVADNIQRKINESQNQIEQKWQQIKEKKIFIATSVSTTLHLH